jgi:hypothetical protein
MSEANLEGVESIRIVTAHGHLRVTRASESGPKIIASAAPRIRRDGAAAEVALHSSAEVRLPAGVALEVLECRGHLELDDLSAPVVVVRVGGNLRVRRAGAILIRERVGGNAVLESCGAFECGRIGGSLLIDRAQGFVRVGHIGGKLEASGTGAIEIESVGAKAIIRAALGPVAIRRVGGRLRLENITGDAAIERVGGHAAVSGVTGNLEIRRVGGALDLRGPFPAGKIWQAEAGGRIEAELDADASLLVDAVAGWGRIRLYGLEESGLERASRGKLRGALGAERPQSERTRLSLETRNADIIIARVGARADDYCGARRRFTGPFDELGDILSEEFGGEIPTFVNSILGAAGRIVARGGRFSSDALREAGGQATGEIADAVEEFSRTLSAQIRRAPQPGCATGYRERRERRETIHEAARKLRRAIREARRADIDERFDPAPASDPHSADPMHDGATRSLDPAAYQGDIMKILHAVKSGELDPEEADEIIEALMEAEQASEAPLRG